MKKEKTDVLQQDMSAKQKIQLAEFNLDNFLWLIAVIFLVCSILFYVFIKVSPVREILLLLSILFFIFVVITQFWK
jgi:hypothetical protein